MRKHEGGWVKQPSEYCPWHRKTKYDKRGAVTAMNKRWADDHERVRIYPCPQCGGWHLTSLRVDEHDA